MSPKNQASNLAEIYAVEQGVEQNIVDLLIDSAGLPENIVFDSLSGLFSDESTRVHVLAELLSSNGRLYEWKTGQWAESGWNANVTVSVVTPIVAHPEEAEMAKSIHFELVGKIRAAMQYGLNADDRRYSGIHALAIRQMGNTTREIDSDANENITAITWEIQVEVRPDAWPS